MKGLLMPPFSTIVSLVGENPLPILLGIRQFAAPDATLIMVHSPDTYNEAVSIRRLCPPGTICEIEQHFKRLSSPYEPATVQTLLKAIFEKYPGAALNYTGGTKVMSAFSLYQMSKSMREEAVLSRAFYLEEEHELFHFGNGTSAAMEDNVTLTLDDLCALHGVELNRLKQPEPLSLANMQNIFNGRSALLGFDIARLPDRRKDYWNWFQDYGAENYSIWQRFLSRLVPDTRKQWEIDADNSTSFDSITAKRLEIANGKWMEQMVRRLVQCLGTDMQIVAFGDPQPAPLIPNKQIVMGQEFFTDPKKQDDYRKFELDVLVIYKRKLFCLSVTTSIGLKLCKGKMCEVQKRAQQVGGGLARSCVICLLDREGIDICRNSLSDNPDELDKAHHTIFGEDDVHDWMNGNAFTLFQFLNS